MNKEQLVGLADREMQEGGLFVYEREAMADTARQLLDFEMPYGMTVRYAAKANPHSDVIRTFDNLGLHFDASSAGEARRILECGVDGGKISLSSQRLEDNHGLRSSIDEGVLPIATSLRQISMLGSLGIDQAAIRFNPGEGSGHNNRTTVGGPASSFGIWKDQLPEALKEADRTGLTIDRVHTHIGSGVSPDVWRQTIQNSLAMVEMCPDATKLDIGGGYKIARMPDEEATDMDEVLGVFAQELEAFKERTGREIHLEIEPGTLLVGNAGTLLGRVDEAKSTSQYDFLVLNVGMNAIMRPAMYGAQHPIEVLNESDEQREYVVVGPCCESGDILTPAPGDPEGIQPRKLKKAEIGDYVAIRGAGAYCASMSAREYNDVPPPMEIVV